VFQYPHLTVGFENHESHENPTGSDPKRKQDKKQKTKNKKKKKKEKRKKQKEKRKKKKETKQKKNTLL